jgi:hypothetical protein
MTKIVTYVFVFAAIAASFSLAAYAQQSQEELDADRAIERIERAIKELRAKETLTEQDKKLIEALQKSKKRLQDMKTHVGKVRSELGKLNKQANSILKRLNDAKLADAEKAIGKKRFTKAAKLLSEVLEVDPDNAKARKTLERILKSVCPAQYRYRHSKEFLRLEGGSPGTESAVTAALRWLHFHQDKDGRWDQDGFDKNCETRNSPKCDGKGTSQYDVGVTGLALLAFMGSGYTHRVGDFKETVKGGLDWLVSQQQKDGSFGERNVESWIYNHAIATQALCEAYALTRDPKLKKPCEKAVEFIIKAQNKDLGWKYKVGSGRNDTSVTGWMVLALHAAKTAGFTVPDSAFKGALAWFDRATNTASKCGYMRPGDDGTLVLKPGAKIQSPDYHYWAKLPAMTGVSVFCRILLGQKRTEKKITKGVDILMANLPNWNKPKNTKVDFYYWFFGTYAMFQYGDKKRYKRYKWNTAMKKALLDTQRIGGCPDGSWDPAGKWGMVGGRVYATAINCLTLEVYYRYARAGAEEKKPSEDKKKDSSKQKTKQDK